MKAWREQEADLCRVLGRGSGLQQSSLQTQMAEMNSTPTVWRMT